MIGKNKIQIGKTEWNLSSLFKDDNDYLIEEYRKKIAEKVEGFASKWKLNSDYLKSANVLKEALLEYEELEIVGPSGGDGAGTLDSFYFWLRSQQELNSSKIKAKYGKSIDFANELFNKLRFFKLNLSKISEDVQREFLNKDLLKEYKHFLERSFAEGRYLLSVEEENILALKSMPAHEYWDKMLSGLLAKEEREVLDENGEHIKKNFSEILSLISNPDKKVRDSAAFALNDIIEKYVEIAEPEINAILTNKKIDDELRKVKRPDFLRHLTDDIDSEVVDSMIEAVSKRFDISRRYYELKAKLLKQDKLEYHERSVPYGKLRKKYSYEEAVNLVYGVFLELDKEFADIFLRFINEGKVDVFPRKGKGHGAFCTDSLKYQPTFVLLNHTNELNDVLTIAHEFGHAINSELMKKKRNTLDCGMVLSTGEVASTFMEDFMLQKLLKEANEEEKLSLLMAKLNDDISSIIRQVAGYRFEKELHKEFREKRYLSKEEIGKIFRRNMENYMGDFVKQDENSMNWWVFWHHIRIFFYVYSYASGLLISKALQSKVKNDRKFILNVKEFLATGMCDSPKNIFAKMGIDISDKNFWDSGLQEVENLLRETEELAKKLGKI